MEAWGKDGRKGKRAKEEGRKAGVQINLTTVG